MTRYIINHPSLNSEHVHYSLDASFHQPFDLSSVLTHKASQHSSFRLYYCPVEPYLGLGMAYIRETQCSQA